MVIKIGLLIIYLILMSLFFILIQKRLATLNVRHKKHIGSICLEGSHKVMMRVIIFLFIVLVFGSSVVIFTVL